MTQATQSRRRLSTPIASPGSGTRRAATQPSGSAAASSWNSASHHRPLAAGTAVVLPVLTADRHRRWRAGLCRQLGRQHVLRRLITLNHLHGATVRGHIPHPDRAAGAGRRWAEHRADRYPLTGQLLGGYHLDAGGLRGRQLGAGIDLHRLGTPGQDLISADEDYHRHHQHHQRDNQISGTSARSRGWPVGRSFVTHMCQDASRAGTPAGRYPR
jgi:hypothetical protein